MRHGQFHHPFLRFPLLVFVLLTILLQFPGSRDLIRVPYSGIETLNLVVQNVEPDSPNSSKDIERNDEIVAVDGEPIRNFNHYRHILAGNTTFASQEYTLARGADSVVVNVGYTAVPSSIVHRRFAHTLVGLTFLLTGLLVLFRRADAVGILFALNCTIISYLLSNHPVFPTPTLQLVGELFDDAAILFFPAVFLHFFLVFPERVRGPAGPVRRRPALWVYSVPALLFTATCVLAVRRFFLFSTPGGALTSILAVSTLYTVGYVLASLIVFTRSYRSSTVGQKEKLRIAIAGTIVGMVPFLAMIAWRQILPGTYTLWELLSPVALVFVSISFAYAILKHGVIELNIVVRKSIVYAFLTGAIVAAYYGVVRFLGDFAAEELNLRPAYSSIIAVLVLAVIFAPAREIVQGVVDRLFHRGDYDYRREVVEFNRQLSRSVKKSEILECFSERMRTLLKSSFVAFYRKGDNEGRFQLAGPVSPAEPLPETFPKDSLLGRYMGRFRKPLMVEYLDHAWGRRHLDGPSREFLRATRASVCLPIVSAESLNGLIVLGPKRSGLLYTRTDSELLETMSEHLSVVLENADLHEAAIQQERLKNEVLLARDIQLSLLPKEPPRHRKLGLLGRMVSSVEVGGDYFDYFDLGESRIGIAIGDVSGKGVPAAMLVASLQAVFKNVALRDKMNPMQVISELNRYLCESAKVGQYATFFFGIIEIDQSTLTFCNAGHCPPLLIKNRYVDRLGEGGMILGVDTRHAYTEGRVALDAGDVLCLYTDGVTEQSDLHGEQFGEERLIDFLKANRNLPLDALQDSLFATVIAFGSGHQHDDISLIIARYGSG